MTHFFVQEDLYQHGVIQSDPRGFSQNTNSESILLFKETMQLLKSLQIFGLWFEETAVSQITALYIPLWALTHRSGFSNTKSTLGR